MMDKKCQHQKRAKKKEEEEEDKKVFVFFFLNRNDKKTQIKNNIKEYSVHTYFVLINPHVC